MRTFAFGADITGLQTFVPFNTMSHWGWHSAPLPAGQTLDEYKGKMWDVHGRQVAMEDADPDHPELSAWLYRNPHRINLGRLGLVLLKSDGTAAAEHDITDVTQLLDLWTGTLSSTFSIETVRVSVVTSCHPALDMLGVTVRSPLLSRGRLKLFVDFPADSGREFEEQVGDFHAPDIHTTKLTLRDHRAEITHRQDEDEYHVTLCWQGDAAAADTALGEHRYVVTPGNSKDLFAFTCAFSPAPLPDKLPDAEGVRAESSRHWPAYWKSGAAIDLSGSTDPRWSELERRVVLSQYLMAVNEAGSLPPQESGLVNNGWNGKFHMEMYWWHAAHWALWNKWNELTPSDTVYERFLGSARKRATAEGYRGARWPKCTGPGGRESPHPIHALLIWQQPHPIFFAELDYRSHPTRETLEKWRDVVFGTADFLTSYAWWDDSGKRYTLGPPMYVVSENTDPHVTQNPTFELSYWRFGLRVAQLWRTRLGLQPETTWARVHDQLAKLPVEDGAYVLYEGISDMWTKWTFEHPALIGVYGWLPGDGVDLQTMRRTADLVFSKWNFNHTWGWDFPMLAMCAARLGRQSQAVDFLLHPSPNFQFDDAGLATGGPYPYFPSNGALLYAVGLMAAGWDGSPSGNAPGFPSDGTWSVKHEGFGKAL
jgi:hypothetical protein